MEAAHGGERQIDLQECWLKDQELKEYFRTNCQEGHQVCLAVQLIREAIAARKKQGQGSMQSNLMSTVKRRDKEVTPKVTQIQPPKSENIRIFGKPRVKLDEGRNCVVHEDLSCENCLNSIAKVNKREEKTAVEESCIRMRTDYDQNRKQAQFKRNSLQQMERSLVSAKKTKERGVQVAEKRETIVQADPTSQKPKQIGRIINKSQPKHNQLLEKTSPKRLSRNRTQQTFTFNQTAMADRLDSTSKMLPFGSRSELIQNDLERKLAEQNKKLERLQKQQEEMMARQFESDRLAPSKIKRKSRQTPFLAESKCSCCSSDSEIISKLTELGLGSNPHIPKAVSSKFLRDRTYKISDNPVYPMSSSTSEVNEP